MRKKYIMIIIPIARNIWYSTISFLLIVVMFCFQSCTKLVTIDPPVSSITTSETFLDSASATSAVLGIYSRLSNPSSGALFFGNGAITVYCGMSADELVPFTSYPTIQEFYHNNVTPVNISISNLLWNSAYTYIYHINACIEGINSSESLSPQLKVRLTGEAKFLRAFCYFYLVNLFGDVPYVISTSWEETAMSSRLPKTEVYQKIITDLLEAQDALPETYTLYGDERIRATKSAARALLSRTYLYSEDWSNAETFSNEVINNSNYQLSPTPIEVFLKNSPEAILQWQSVNEFTPFNATSEGYNFIPADRTLSPTFYLSETLLNSFEISDTRRYMWIDSTIYDGKTYFIPYKYKIGPAQSAPGQPISEYYMILRLAEQYLVRAEARLNQNNLVGALEDINIIRKRSQLQDISTGLTKEQISVAIANERRIELFAEWGHRWNDLRRTNTANTVLQITKGNTWQITDQLYPLPYSELSSNPKLTQNAGY